MKTVNLCIKVLAVVLMIGAGAVAYGMELVQSAFAENSTRRERILDIGIKTESSAIAKLEQKVLGKRKSAAIKGNIKDLPFLVNRIKYNTKKVGGYICFYNSNQRMLYNILSETCVYFAYDCDIGEGRLDCESCREEAVKGVYEAFSKVGTPVLIECEKVWKNDKIFVFSVKTDMTGDGIITVAVRRDTGSIVLYDAISAVRKGNGLQDDTEGAICQIHQDTAAYSINFFLYIY